MNVANETFAVVILIKVIKTYRSGKVKFMQTLGREASVCLSCLLAAGALKQVSRFVNCA